MSKPSPPSYRRADWPACNASLYRRGSLSVWFGHAMNWNTKKSGERGRSETCADAAIRTCIMLNVVFGLPLRLPLRQTVRLAERLFQMAGLTGPCRISRRHAAATGALGKGGLWQQYQPGRSPVPFATPRSCRKGRPITSPFPSVLPGLVRRWQLLSELCKFHRIWPRPGIAMHKTVQHFLLLDPGRTGAGLAGGTGGRDAPADGSRHRSPSRGPCPETERETRQDDPPHRSAECP
ncbi:transposase [Leisingera sp.]|uniref:transposase n=1 Tax=Leisingera sp. TaxID=1879318 RepID=UPI003A5C37C0